MLTLIFAIQIASVFVYQNHAWFANNSFIICTRRALHVLSGAAGAVKDRLLQFM